MPNTLAHLGVGYIATRALWPGADRKWIYAGCVIPDVPWILQRLIPVEAWDLDPYACRLYFIGQASLVGCLFLAGALAAFSSRATFVFAILSFNAAAHLLLDACQTKWGNGVHLFAPFSWDCLNYSLFWPESPITLGLNLLALATFALGWWRCNDAAVALAPLCLPRLLFAAAFVAAYFLLPLCWQHEIEESDAHFVNTLRQAKERTGKYVELDRSHFAPSLESGRIQTFSGERLAITPTQRPAYAGTVSVRGIFVATHRLEILELHHHPESVRDLSSLIGLNLVIVIWLQSVAGKSATAGLRLKRRR